jgi:hypothetical protein
MYIATGTPEINSDGLATDDPKGKDYVLTEISGDGDRVGGGGEVGVGDGRVEEDMENLGEIAEG